VTRRFVRTVLRLADGRELLYYDAAPGAERSEPDRRSLEPLEVSSEIRQDRLVDEPVIIAAHRQTRTHLPPSDACPLCPSRPPDRLTEIPATDYEVVVFENRFPSFANPGRAEVVCFTADHDASFASLGPDRVRLVIEAWADRTAQLSRVPGVDQVFVFENRGEAIGVTLHHPHGQIYGYPFVTPRTRRMLDVAAAHRAAGGSDLVGGRLLAERDGPRVVIEGELWTAFVPEAARWPIEVHLVPHRFVPDMAQLDEAERDELARIYPELLRRFDRFHDRPIPYIAAWHAAPVREGRDLLRLHLQLFTIQRAPDKLKYLAGSESAMGAFINDLVPEETARRLRDA
jgi:UDPglucose--hexose-1-phosphate uridylyltransferase